MRLTARLIDVQSEATAEAFKVDGRQEDLFELQDRLADAVRAAVQHLTGRAVAGARIVAEDAGTRAGNGNGNGNGAARAGNGNGSGNGGSLVPDASTGGRGPAAAGIAGGELLLGATPAPRSAPAPAAQAGPAAGFAIGGRRNVQARRAVEPPTIDGRLDDAVWRDAVLITDFTQTNPIEGAPPTERTEAWIAYDADHIYFAFYAHYTDPSQMRANRADRDRFCATTGSR